MKALAKKPLSGGKPAREKNMSINEKAQILLTLNKPVRFEMKRGCISFKLKKFVCF